MKFVSNLTELRNPDTALAGGKAASLGELINAGVNVPPGFVVTTEAYKAFLEDTDLAQTIKAHLTSPHLKGEAEIKRTAGIIRQLILEKDIPQQIIAEVRDLFNKQNLSLVAVRSSATSEDSANAAWAGQLDSFLNVTAENLLDSIKQCWASLFTERALFYRIEKGLLDHAIAVAVVVQKMVCSEVSGVAFSVHPVTGSSDEIVIDAGYGLGEAIVSGQITPDNYIVDKPTLTVKKETIERQERELLRAADGTTQWHKIAEPKASAKKLAPDKIISLATTVKDIEKHYQHPCDIEWAYEQGTFFIVQCRPVTTHLLNTNTNLIPDHYIPFTQHEGVAPFLMSFGFFLHIHDLGAIVQFDGKTRTSFISKTALEKTLTAGVELYSNTAAYNKLKQDTRISYNLLTQAAAKLSQDYSPQTVIEFLDQATAFSALYRYTEFFYTDRAYSLATTLPEIAHNFESFEDFKLEGRRMINALSYGSECFMRHLINHTAQHFSMQREDIESYTGAELLALFDGKKIAPELVRQRKEKYFIYSMPNSGIAQKYQQEATPYISLFSHQDTAHGKITGQTACAGIVQGRARVAHITLDNFEAAAQIIHDIEAGEILVADSTIPEILPACKKAVGIITNQGGMMSHAAIVSRELNIPCLVGARAATSQIKTGDMVLLNASEGYCTIL